MRPFASREGPVMAKAVRFDHYGGIDLLYLADVEVPHPPSGEVTVAVRAAGVNPGEAAIRQGYLDSMYPTTFPSGEGSDLAGVVTELGGGVDAWAVGDEVLGWTDRRASHAEYVTVPDSYLIRKPRGLSWEVAGSLYVVGVTAYAAVTAVEAGPGDTVVVSAAAGGVGSITVQLLKVRGADVIGIASAANHQWLTSRGVTPVAYGDDLAQRIGALAPTGVDAFIDTFGEEYVRLAKTEGSSMATSTEVLAEMADLVASGRIIVPIADTFPLDQVRAAYVELEKRHTRGKIVLIP
jgi:NADPH:quinone reductase-like Zn-dependent oxidoreductase